MEKPRVNIERPQDEYDHELTQLQANAIALADELLKLKEKGSQWTFVDIVFDSDPNEMLAEIQAGPMAELLAAPDEQLAIESDGSYYPVLDVRKQNGKFIGMGLRVFGWDDDKRRYTKDTELGPPFESKKYPGEIDKTREIEIAMSYQVGKETVTEDLKIYVSSRQPDYIYASTQLSMPVYAETGYEGHGGKSADVSNEALEWFLDFVAKHVGDQPKSVAQYQQEKINVLRSNAERHGALKGVDKLIKDTWNAQAMYLMNLPCRLLEGNISIAKGLESEETAQQAGDAARLLAKQYKAKIMDSKAGGEWIVSSKYGNDESNDEDD